MGDAVEQRHGLIVGAVKSTVVLGMGIDAAVARNYADGFFQFLSWFSSSWPVPRFFFLLAPIFPSSSNFCLVHPVPSSFLLLFFSFSFFSHLFGISSFSSLLLSLRSLFFSFFIFHSSLFRTESTAEKSKAVAALGRHGFDRAKALGVQRRAMGVELVVDLK
jgi:hypothetical protein